MISSMSPLNGRTFDEAADGNPTFLNHRDCLS